MRLLLLAFTLTPSLAISLHDGAVELILLVARRGVRRRPSESSAAHRPRRRARVWLLLPQQVRAVVAIVVIAIVVVDIPRRLPLLATPSPGAAREEGSP